MNIVIGKFGRSIKFKTANHGAVGGDNEPPALYLSMALANPDNTYYMIGKSDMDRCGIELPTNLVNVWSNYNSKSDSEIDWVTNWFTNNNITVDAGVIMSGPGGESQPGLLSKQNYPAPAKFLSMSSSGKGPLVHYLNHSNIPWVMIVQDPRYSKIGRDVLNRPKRVLGQYKEIVKELVIRSFDLEDQRPTRWQAVRQQHTYDQMEKIFLMGKQPSEPVDKTIPFMMVLNEGKGRYGELDRFVLRHFDNIEIYGKWLNKKTENDPRFKGPMKFEELQAKLPAVKYTFIIPIDQGWVTSKVWEMAYHGVIPFMHPTYDEQRNVPVPDFIRVSSPVDLLNKITQLDNDPVLYNQIRQQLLDMIKPEDYDGSNINKIITQAVNEITKL